MPSSIEPPRPAPGAIPRGGGPRAIVTVIGEDRIGIIAGISGLLAEAGVNILDISMTILQEFFTMIMIVDLTLARHDFVELARRLEERGESLGVRVTMQQADVFQSMHRV